MPKKTYHGEIDPNRQPGRPGVDAILLDYSGSMNDAKAATLSEAFRQLMPSLPDANIIGFSHEAKRISYRQVIKKTHGVLGGTDLIPALRLAMALQPSRTVIVSDGSFDDADEIWEPLDRMTGSVSTIYVYENWPSKYYSKRMAKIARRCGGVCVETDGGNPQAITWGILRAPVFIKTEVRVYHHHLPPKHFHHGKPQDADIRLEPARVNVSYRPALPPQRHEALPASKYRGTLQSAPQPLQIEQQRQLPTLAPVKKKTGWFW